MEKATIDVKKLFKLCSGMKADERGLYIQGQLTAILDDECNEDWFLSGESTPPKKVFKIHIPEGSRYSVLFEKFWSSFPPQRRNGKGAAFKAWCKQAKILNSEELLLKSCQAALKWQPLSELWKDGYVPMPSTYLNQARYDDECPFEFEAGGTTGVRRNEFGEIVTS